VAPGLLSRADIVILCRFDFCRRFWCLVLDVCMVLVMRLCFGRSCGRVIVVFERTKYHQKCFGLVDAKANGGQGAPLYY
jgi:hypothetical protein